MPTDVRFCVDRLVVSGKRVFVWGWVADRERSISDVHLKLRGRGWQKRLAATFGLAREDVVEALPSHVAARFSGFVVTGYVPDASVEALSLEVTFDDGHCATLDLGGVAEVSTPSRLWRAVRRKLKARDFGSLLRLHRVKERKSRRPTNPRAAKRSCDRCVPRVRFESSSITTWAAARTITAAE